MSGTVDLTGGMKLLHRVPRSKYCFFCYLRMFCFFGNLYCAFIYLTKISVNRNKGENILSEIQCC